MRYLMLVCRDPAITMTPEERAAMRDSVIAWVEEMAGRGILLPGGSQGWRRPAASALSAGRSTVGGHASPDVA